MFRYDRNCSFAADFVFNTTFLAMEMIRAGYKKRRLVTEVIKYGPNWDRGKGTWPHTKRRIITTITARTLALHTNTPTV